jgi:hypothetical protein
MKTFIRTLAIFTFVLIVSATAFAQKTVVRDATAKRMLLGNHKLALQWISWDYFGIARVTEKSGVVYIKGEQKQRRGTDFVTVDGRITEINAKDFVFEGTIITQVSHINGGQPCTREGEFTFRITGKRRYWRLKEIDNPCDQVADYVDVFFR